MKIPFLMTIGALLVSGASGQLPGGIRYVSMGSSYAAGPGVGTPDHASGACGRSMSNYARQVAGWHHFDLVDVACSGATVDTILVHGQHGFPAQIEAVTPDTKLVSILIGGNDVGYVGNLLGLSCRDSGGTACHVGDAAEVARRLAALPGRLDRVIAEVRHRAAGARIVLLGYLPAVPASGGRDCVGLPLSPADIGWLRGVSIRLARVIGQAAVRNHVGVVRSSLIGAGHDVCSTTPFVTGFHPPRNPGWSRPVAYHPTQAGMDRLAAALDAAIAD